MSRSEPSTDVIRTVHYATGGVFEIGVRERLEERRSAFQQIVVVDTHDHGRCLVLDGVLQTASTDHQIYDDAILAPLRGGDLEVLVVGGGDGYVARRVRELAPGAHVTIVDIDPEVIEVAERWLNPGLCSDPDTTVHIGDGVAFARGLPPASVDGAVLDLTDLPVDPTASGDVRELYERMLDAVLPAVRPGGWLSMQGGPSAVPAGETDVATTVGELVGARLDRVTRLDVTLPSYAEGNAFFHGTVRGGRR